MRDFIPVPAGTKDVHFQKKNTDTPKEVARMSKAGRRWRDVDGRFSYTRNNVKQIEPFCNFQPRITDNLDAPREKNRCPLRALCERFFPPRPRGNEKIPRATHAFPGILLSGKIL